jgi:hypothetical protein
MQQPIPFCTDKVRRALRTLKSQMRKWADSILSAAHAKPACGWCEHCCVGSTDSINAAAAQLWLVLTSTAQLGTISNMGMIADVAHPAAALLLLVC